MKTIKRKLLNDYEKAALNWMMVRLAHTYATCYMGLGESNCPNFDDCIAWSNDCVLVLDGGSDFLEVGNRLGMREAFINEDDNLSYIDCVVLNEDYEPIYHGESNDEIHVYAQVDIDSDEFNYFRLYTDYGKYIDESFSMFLSSLDDELEEEENLE